jgi:hypothetical protein
MFDVCRRLHLYLPLQAMPAFVVASCSKNVPIMMLLLQAISQQNLCGSTSKEKKIQHRSKFAFLRLPKSCSAAISQSARPFSFSNRFPLQTPSENRL